jgi:uncharacterized protein YgbK (DUF1537 family)
VTERHNGPAIGCVADDFTGATDLGNTLARQGLRVSQLVGVPDDDRSLPPADAEIVALKTRTAPPGDAVRDSVAALAWLRRRGTSRFVFKVCSTFDSRPDGNIGPVADALSDALHVRTAVVCPAFPEAGRTVYRGQLFVGGQRLDESSMADHPLTPMRDASVVRLLQAQTDRHVGLIDYDVVRLGPASIARAFDERSAAGVGYVVVDALEDRHLRDIGAAIAAHPLVVGASGIVRGLPDALRAKGVLGTAGSAAPMVDVAGATAILAGSASPSTREQIDAIDGVVASIGFDPLAVAVDPARLSDVVDAVVGRLPKVPLLHPSSTPEAVARVQASLGRDEAARVVESVLAAAAVRLVAAGVRRLIVAGGETSAAVVHALGVRGLVIGPEIRPGVPWCTTMDEPRLALALKSGNLGGPTFFGDALAMLP